MRPAARKAALVAHVMTSVGWLGAVVVFLALAVTALRSRDDTVVRAEYVAMDVATRYAIVPLAMASLVTGLLSSLGTTWGLVRHWWVLIKLALTVVATALLLLHTQPIGHLGELAAGGAAFDADARRMQVQLLVDAAAALLVLIGATALAVVKPRGLTPLGRRRA